MKKLFRIDIDNTVEPAEHGHGFQHCYCTQLIVAADEEEAKNKAKICAGCVPYSGSPSITVRAVERLGRYQIIVEERIKTPKELDEVDRRRQFLDAARRSQRERRHGN